MGGNGWIEDRFPVPLESGKRALLVAVHQVGKADYVGREDSG